MFNGHGRCVLVVALVAVVVDPVGSSATAAAPSSIDVLITSGADDAEERASGVPTITSSDLEIVEESGSAQTVGLRFANIDIPPDAAIHSATIQFTTDEVSTDSAALQLRAEDTGNAAPFTSSALNVSSRPVATPTVDWNPAPWSTVGERGVDQMTPNIASLVQAAVSRPDWVANNAMAFIIDGSGSRVAESFDGSAAAAAALHIEYEPSAAIIAPVISTAGPMTGSPGTVVTIGGTGFIGTTEVAFAGTPAEFGIVSDTQLLVRVPQAAVTGPITATNAAGTGSSQTDFVVAAAAPLEVPGQYPTIQAAIDAALDGDTVLVAQGTYPAAIVINKTITLASHFINTGDPADVSGTMIESLTADDAIFVGPNVGPTTRIVGLTLSNPTQIPAIDGIKALATLQILDNRIDGFDDGIDLDPVLPQVASCLCLRNTIENGLDDGIDLDGASESVIEDNILRNNHEDGIEIRLDDFAGVLNVSILNNEITGNGQDGIQIIDQVGGVSDRRFVIDRNLIANSGRAGIGLMDNGNSGEDYRAASLPDSIHLTNNTFSGNNHALSGGDNLVAVNNIFANNVVGVKGVDAGSTIAHGLFWNNATDAISSNIDAPTTSNADPLFDPDFMLQTGSPAIDTGTAFFQWAGQTIVDLQPGDYGGVGPDLGAYEVSGSDLTPPTVLTTTPTDGESDVLVGEVVTATFSEAMDAATILPTSFSLTVQGSATVLPATVTYDAASSTALLDPTDLLDPGTAYEATVFGGVGGVDDVAGNSLQSDFVWSFSTQAADLNPPETAIQSGPADPTSATGATFVFTADEPASTFECSLDGAPASTCTSPQAYSALADGSHTFDVAATDPAGNSDVTPDTWSWTIDTVAPGPPTITSPADQSTNTTGIISFLGAAEPLSLVTVLDSGSPVGTATVDATGAWTLEVTATGNGDHPYSAIATDGAGNTSTSSTIVTITVALPGIVIAAAGDIACDPGSGSFNGGAGTPTECQQMATSDLLLDPTIDAVIPLGDTQYTCGGGLAYAQSYDPSWGRVKSITYPVIGNHEYDISGTTDCDPTGSAVGYFNYFGAAAGDPATGYYSYDLGSWHFVALNTECGQVGGCQAGSTQEQWLRADLAASTAECTAVYMHRPRWSSGPRHGSDPNMGDLFEALYENGVELVLSGHDHLYERFAPQDPSGGAQAAGTRAFVVGTGGVYLDQVGPLQPNSESTASVFGVLKLSLNDTSYDWEFLPIAGETFSDTGSTACHSIADVASDTAIDSGPLDFTLQTSATFEFSASENGATFECSLDAAPFTPCSSPLTYTGVADGNHLFEVRAVDLDANIDASPATWDWTIDTSVVEFHVAADADAYVLAQDPDSNFGSANVLLSDLSPVETSYLRFDVSGLTGPVAAAELRLFATNGTTDGPSVYSVESAWDENLVTFNSAPARIGGVLDSAGAISTNSMVVYDLTPVIGGDGIYSFELGADSSNGADFHSRESTSPAKPQLVLFIGAGPPTPTVSITATDANAAEPGADVGTFTISRSGATDEALSVAYGVTGTATAGADYLSLPGSITIPIGQASEEITISAVDDGDVEGPETVEVTLTADAAYTVGTPASDSIVIADDDLPEVTIVATDASATEPDGGTQTGLVATGPGYFVSSLNGSDSNVGTSAAEPWRTLAMAASAVLPGDTIYLERGSLWSEPVELDVVASPGLPVALTPYGAGNAPIIEGQSTCIRLNGSHIRVEGLNISNCSFSGVRISGDNNVVHRNIISGNAAGVFVELGASNNSIQNNTLTDNNVMTVLTPGGDDDSGAFGILIHGDHTDVGYNTITGSDAFSFDYGRDGSAVEIFGGTDNYIHHNVAAENDAFIELGQNGSDSNTIAYNVVTSTLEGSTFLVTRGALSSFGPVLGTVADNNSVYLTGASSQGFVCTSGCGPTILSLHNNVIQAGWKVGAADALFDGDNNVFFGGSIEFTPGPQSIVADPQFVDAVGGDLRLLATSPGIDLGTPLGYSEDIDGVALPVDGDADGFASPDAGAHELDPAIFTVSRTGSPSTALTVLYTVGGSASPGGDYVALSGAVTIPVGQVSEVIAVTPLDDESMEGPETLAISVTSDATYVVGPASSDTATINDDDVPEVTVVASDPIASEPGTDTAAFTISRTGPTTAPLTVTYGVGGGALAGSDYVPLPGTVVIPVGQAAEVITVTALDDGVAELPETVVLMLTAAATYAVGSPASGSVTIDDDGDGPEVTVAATDSTASEPGSDTATFTVTRSGPTGAALTVSYLVGGSASAGADYTALSGTVTIPVGQATGIVTVTALDDAEVEPPETVDLTLSVDPAYAVGVPANDSVTINDDDLPQVTVVATDAAASEPGTDTGIFTVSRTGPTTSPLTITYSVDGSAIAGVDYVALSGVVTIPVGQATADITVTVVDDALAETSETVDMSITVDSAYLNGAPASGTVTIDDDGDLPEVTVVATDAAASEPGTDTGIFTVSRTGPTTAALTITYSVDGSASAGADYTTLSGTVTIPVGQATGTVIVTALDDAEVEPPETVDLTLSADAAYVVGVPANDSVTINDDDDQVPTQQTFSPSADTYLDEGDPGSNFGSATSLSVDGNSGRAEDALLKFDVSGISGAAQSATLRVFVTNATSNGPTVTLTETTWDESLVTWDTKPSVIGSVIVNAGSVPSGSWFEFDVTSAIVGPGTYSFTLVAESSNGLNFNSREIPAAAPELVVVASTAPDTTPPNLSSTSPLDGAVDVTTSSTVSATFSEPMDSATIDSSTFTLSDGVATVVASVMYDPATTTATLSPSTALDFDQSYTATITTAATDAAGNPLTTAIVWTFTTALPDTTPPQTTIVGRPDAQTTSTDATFTFTADEPGSTFECALDFAAPTPCTSPISYSSLSIGAHHFDVVATDPAGNTDASAATWDWTIAASSTLTVIASADTYLHGNQVNSNFGGATTLLSDGNPDREALLRFDVSGLVVAPQSVTLRIFITNGSPAGPDVFPTATTWDENAVTWNTRPALTGPAVASAGPIPSGSWYEYDLTALVTTNAVYSLNLTPTSNNAIRFSSRETANQPHLVIEQ